jgi:PAS domain S-box-containing protein
VLLAIVSATAAWSVVVADRAARGWQASLAITDLVPEVYAARYAALADLTGARASALDSAAISADEAGADEAAQRLSRLSALGPPVARLVAQLNDEVTTEMADLSDGRLALAQAEDSAAVGPTYRALGALVAKDDALLDAAAARAQHQGTAEVVAVVVLSAALVAGVLSAFETSRRRRATADAQAAARRGFEAMVASGSDLLVVTDGDGTATYVSPSARRLLGLEPGTITGTPFEDLFHPDDRSLLALGRAGPLDVRARRADGSWCAMNATVSELLGVPGVAGTLWALRDVTAQMALEAQLRHAQKMESVGQLAAGIAHEINSPVQFIGDNVRFMAEAFATFSAWAPADDAEAGYFLAEVPKATAQALDGIDRVARIVRAMRYFGHPGNEEKAPVDLNEVVRNTLVVAASELKHVADVSADLVELPTLWGHRGDINQVLLNLVVNAAHAIADKVGDSGERGVVAVRTWHDDDSAFVSVTDTGMGIPREVARRVFEPFFTTKEPGKGTGQGLAIAYSLVKDRHGGDISFDTVEGTGTTFTVRLPVGTGPVPTVSQAAAVTVSVTA